MSTDLLGMFKKYAGPLGKGLLAEFAPGIVKGALVEVLKAKGTNVQGASEWVNHNTSLWDILEPGQRQSLKRLSQVVDLSWLTADWAIGAMKDELPALASLFLGWPKAHRWLERQFKDIGKKLAGEETT